jgi:NADH-quinone oxidoreductase subunit L
VNGFGYAVSGVSGALRKAQTGNIGFYVFVMVISIALILFVQLF